MSNLDTLRNNLINAFYDNSVMLNVSLNIEKFLADDVVLYPYAGWENAELIGGPYLKRYFVSVIFRFDYEDMPDPEGAKVLQKFDINVKYKKVKELEVDYEKSKDNNEIVKKPIYAWYVQLDIPHRLVSDERQAEFLKDIEDVIDIEAIENVADETSNGEDFNDFDSNNDFGGDGFDQGFDEPMPEPTGDDNEKT